MGEDTSALLASSLGSDELRDLSNAAALVRDDAAKITAVTVQLPALDEPGAAALERACALAVADGALAIDVEFRDTVTTVKVTGVRP
jgi:hypothetical protein